jgi:hypothetical protein
VAKRKPTPEPAENGSKKAKKRKSKGKGAWKVLGSGSAVFAGVATARALDAVWRTATGRRPPTKPESPAIAGREALLWAGLSGMAIGVAKTYATRRAAQYWVKSTGELPPGMADKADDKAAAKKARRALARS